MYSCGGSEKYSFMTIEQISRAHTRQLLAELRRTYRGGCPYCWKNSDWNQLYHYRNELKRELATREHIPNKKESKAIRKAKIKKGE